MREGTAPFRMASEQYPSWRFLRARGVVAKRSARGPEPPSYDFLWARNAIYHGLAAQGVGEGDRVLLPAYLCVAAVAPVLALGATVDFYEVTRDCRPVLEDIEAKLGPRTRAVMCVHYFGFPQDLRALRDLCDRHRLVLIEDCAHVLPDPSGGDSMGRVGAIAVFSWRKLLPIGDGASLVLNRGPRDLAVSRRREGLAGTLKVAKDLCDRMIAQSRWTGVRRVYRALERPKALFRRQMRQAALPVERDDTLFDRDLADAPMTRLSAWVLAHSDIAAIRRARRVNYQFLHDRTAGVAGLRALFPRLDAGVCPWVFPLFFEGRPRAHHELRRMGIPAVAWEGVRPPGVSGQQFPSADFLYENLTFLPVHQNLTERDLELIAEGVLHLAQGRPA
jgi:perosamine synthetase